MGGKGSGRKKKVQEVPAENKNLKLRISSKKEEILNKIEKLKFIRIYDIRLVPRYLFEQIKPRIFDIDEIYEMANKFENDPLILMFAMADEEYKIKGFLWSYVDSILKTLCVETLTVDKEYQHRGEIIEKVMNFLIPFKEKLGLRAIRFLTNRPKAFIRFGAKSTGETYLEV